MPRNITRHTVDWKQVERSQLQNVTYRIRNGSMRMTQQICYNILVKGELTHNLNSRITLRMLLVNNGKYLKLGNNVQRPEI
jgi:hypothetical protein